MKRLFIALLLLACVALALNVKGGRLAQNTTWTPADNPVILTGNVEVPDSLTLRIEAGTLVKFDGYFHILVHGTFQALGEAGREIEFSSNRENPGTDSWEGLIFYGEASKGTLVYCRVRHAFRNFLWKSSPLIQHCTFTGNNYALYCSYSKTAKILDNVFTKNNFGIYCDFSSPIIQKNKITGNGYGLYCILSSAPVVGENEITANTDKDIYMDESMGKNQSENINNHVWDLMKGLF
ncbi:MAG: right-handed parallel beta-helix repeat-containing protein [Fibrobacterota bacterium]